MNININHFTKLTPIYSRYPSRKTFSTNSLSTPFTTKQTLSSTSQKHIAIIKHPHTKSQSRNHTQPNKKRKYPLQLLQGSIVDLHFHATSTTRCLLTTLSHTQSCTPSNHIQYNASHTYGNYNSHNDRKNVGKHEQCNTHKLFQNSILKNAFTQTKKQNTCSYKQLPKMKNVFNAPIKGVSSSKSNHNIKSLRINNAFLLEIRNPNIDFKSVYTKVRFKQIMGISLSNKKLITRLSKLGLSP